MRLLALLVIVLTACGRIGFDELTRIGLGDGDGGAGGDGGGTGAGGDGGAGDGAIDAAFVANCSPACLPTDYCATPVGQCAQPGTCSVKPMIGTCPDVVVCGCDGVTYGNACDAANAGVGVQSTGAGCATS